MQMDNSVSLSLSANLAARSEENCEADGQSTCSESSTSNRQPSQTVFELLQSTNTTAKTYGTASSAAQSSSTLIARSASASSSMLSSSMTHIKPESTDPICDLVIKQDPEVVSEFDEPVMEADRAHSFATETTGSSEEATPEAGDALSIYPTVESDDDQSDLTTNFGHDPGRLEIRELLDIVLSATNEHDSSVKLQGLTSMFGPQHPPVGLMTQLLWRSGALNDHKPWLLTFSMWWMIHHYFDIGNRSYHVNLRWGYLRLVKNVRDPMTDELCEAIDYVGPNDFVRRKSRSSLEHSTMSSRIYPSTGWSEAEVTVASVLADKIKPQVPRMRPLDLSVPVPTTVDRSGPNFVELYKAFTAQRKHSSLQPDAPFYLRPLHHPRFNIDAVTPKDRPWFSGLALGKNSIGSLMSNIVKNVVRPKLSSVGKQSARTVRQENIGALHRATLALPTSNILGKDRRCLFITGLACALGLQASSRDLGSLMTEPVQSALSEESPGTNSSEQVKAPCAVTRSPIHQITSESHPPVAPTTTLCIVLNPDGTSYQLVAATQPTAQQNNVYLLTSGSNPTPVTLGNQVILNPQRAVTGQISVGAEHDVISPIMPVRFSNQTSCSSSGRIPITTLNNENPSNITQVVPNAIGDAQLERRTLMSSKPIAKPMKQNPVPSSSASHITLGQFVTDLTTSSPPAPQWASSTLFDKVKLKAEVTQTNQPHSKSTATTKRIHPNDQNPIYPHVVTTTPFKTIQPIMTGNISNTVTCNPVGSTTVTAMSQQCLSNLQVTPSAILDTGTPISSVQYMKQNPVPSCSEAHVPLEPFRVDPTLIDTQSLRPATSGASIHPFKLKAEDSQTDQLRPYSDVTTECSDQTTLSVYPVLSQEMPIIKPEPYESETTTEKRGIESCAFSNYPSSSSQGAIKTSTDNKKNHDMSQKSTSVTISLVPSTSGSRKLPPQPRPDELFTLQQAPWPYGYPFYSVAQGIKFNVRNFLYNDLQTIVENPTNLNAHHHAPTNGTQAIEASRSLFQCNDFPAFAEQLFHRGLLGTSRPWLLNFSAWFINSVAFGVDNRLDHAKLRWGDFSIGQLVNADGCQDFVYYYNPVTKRNYYLVASPPERLGFNVGKTSVNGISESPSLCPVSVFKGLLTHRPASCMDKNSKFYLQAKPDSEIELFASFPSHRVEWFFDRPWGKNKLGSLLNEATQMAGLPPVRKQRLRYFVPNGGMENPITARFLTLLDEKDLDRDRKRNAVENPFRGTTINPGTSEPHESIESLPKKPCLERPV